MTAILAGTVEQFGAAARTTYKQSLSSTLGVPSNAIELIVTAASVSVEARITPTTAVTASALMSSLTAAVQTAATVSGATVQSISSPASVVVTRSAPPPPPPSPQSPVASAPLPLVSEGNGTALTRDGEDDSSARTTAVIIVIVSVVLILGIVGGLVISSRKNASRPLFNSVVATTVQAEVQVSSIPLQATHGWVVDKEDVEKI